MDIIYCFSQCVTLIEGDGIGPEISRAVIKVFEAAGAPITWEPVDVSPVKTPDGRVTVPEGVIQSMERNKIGLKGTDWFSNTKYTQNNFG